MYKSGRGNVQVQVVFDTNTFWLSQQRMAELFEVIVPTINYHLDQIGQMVRKGDDVVIAVGYRMNSYEIQ